jgi:hypothetical protein
MVTQCVPNSHKQSAVAATWAEMHWVAAGRRASPSPCSAKSSFPIGISCHLIAGGGCCQSRDNGERHEQGKS